MSHLPATVDGRGLNDELDLGQIGPAGVASVLHFVQVSVLFSV